VIERGVYGVVRQPMSAGALPPLVGMPLWLASYAVALLASVPIGTLVVRIVVEEPETRTDGLQHLYGARPVPVHPVCLVGSSWIASPTPWCWLAHATLHLTARHDGFVCSKPLRRHGRCAWALGSDPEEG
jgi:hypothetical protein